MKKIDTKKPSLVTPKRIVLKVNKIVVMKTGVIPVKFCENKTATCYEVA
jgi:hypothetical protein